MAAGSVSAADYEPGKLVHAGGSRNSIKIEPGSRVQLILEHTGEVMLDSAI